MPSPRATRPPARPPSQTNLAQPSTARAKTWRRPPAERRRPSFLHALGGALLETFRRARSFGELSAPRPKASLEVYVSACGVAWRGVAPLPNAD